MLITFFMAILQKNRFFLVIILAFFSFIVSCKSDKKGLNISTQTSKLSELTLASPDTTIKIKWNNKYRNVYIIPSLTFFSKGNILLLHGWNLPPLGWCEQTTLCEKLRKSGFNIIIPDMGKSMYASEIYDETLPIMAAQPQLYWLTDTVLVTLSDSLNIFSPTANNFLVGLSTGARGAFAVGLLRPEIFKAAVVLSGDYDQTLMPNDNLMTYFYGSYEDFPERWKGQDNLLSQANNWSLPIYIGHGQKDNVVPFEQSDTLYKTLVKIGKVEIISNFPKHQKHDYTYWESESENIIKFINAICDKEKEDLLSKK